MTDQEEDTDGVSSKSYVFSKKMKILTFFPIQKDRQSIEDVPRDFDRKKTLKHTQTRAG